MRRLHFFDYHPHIPNISNEFRKIGETAKPYFEKYLKPAYVTAKSALDTLTVESKGIIKKNKMVLAATGLAMIALTDGNRQAYHTFRDDLKDWHGIAEANGLENMPLHAIVSKRVKEDSDFIDAKILSEIEKELGELIVAVERKDNEAARAYLYGVIRNSWALNRIPPELVCIYEGWKPVWRQDEKKKADVISILPQPPNGFYETIDQLVITAHKKYRAVEKRIVHGLILDVGKFAAYILAQIGVMALAIQIIRERKRRLT